MARNIKIIIAQFKKLSDADRYKLLSELLEGKPEDPPTLAWRAKLCTALERAKVYPMEKPLDALNSGN